MAPSPELDKEPKAPDKSQPQVSGGSLSDNSVQLRDSQCVTENTGNVSGANADAKKSGQLENLDEGQLKTLLDEAATYRRPKDREGKSLLFKELLQKAEQDSEAEWGRQCYRRARRSLGGGGARRNGTRPPLTHSGSLQDLAESVGGGGVVAGGRGGRSSKQRGGRGGGGARQVSAHTQQGGSLPSNVDQQHTLSVVEGGLGFLEDVRCGGTGGGDYIATVHCVNPPTGYYYTGHRADSPIHRCYTTEDLDTRSQSSSHVSSNYLSRATLEIGSPALDSDNNTSSSTTQHNTSSTATASADDSCNSLGDDATNNNTVAVSQMDTSVVTLSPSSSPLQLASTYCSVKSVVGDDVPPVSVMSPAGSSAATLTVTSSVSHPITTASTASSHLNITAPCNLQARPTYQLGKLDGADFKKSLDENGNSVQSMNATITTSGVSIGKKTKKKKCKNETEINPDTIDGYRGRLDIDDILKFIESDAGDVGKGGTKGTNGSKTNSLFNGKLSGKEGKSKDDSHEKGTKKRSSDRRGKDGMDKLKKSNSMEELSRRKMDDLTTSSSSNKDNSLSLRKTKKQSDNVDEAKRNDRRSWGNDGSDSYYHEASNEALSINTSNTSSSSSSVSSKAKKPSKVSPRPAAEVDPVVSGVEAALEAADFQTVTNKKKIRKRHSPVDESRARNHGNHTKNGRFIGHDRDITKKSMEKKNAAMSSPPSDSNDDLESVHSSNGEAGGEKVQASYADMARAAAQRIPSSVPAPPSPPPPSPPNLLTTQQRVGHNFPDLIESCNYYNERNINDKYMDVSSENCKNLLLKETSPSSEGGRCKAGRGNIVDAGTQVETSANHVTYPIYSDEQYPALEPKQRALANGKAPLHKSNSVGGATGGKTCVVKANSVGGGERRPPNKTPGDQGSVEGVTDYYVAYVEHSTSNSEGLEGEGKYSRPPDVVLPIPPETDPTTGARPPVIILNEEVRKSLDMDGITFGFDINEQLLNGDSCTNSNNSDVVYSNNNSVDSSSGVGGGEEGSEGLLRVGRSKALALRYLPPPDTANSTKDLFNLERLVHYVGMAWEDAIKSPGGKVRYFSE